MTGRMWIRIAKDPLGRNLVDAMSLGSEGTAFAGYAIDVPEDFFEGIEDKLKYFDIIDEDEVTDEERAILANNRGRNAAFRAEANRNAATRRAARMAEQARTIAAATAAALTDDMPDSDDD